MIEAVNEGIDSHLEACYCPDRGDRYEGGKRKAGKLVLCRTLECSISPESLPVLLRRLCESDLGGDPEVQAEGNRLASDILMVLGINEYGEFVGREALVIEGTNTMKIVRLFDIQWDTDGERPDRIGFAIRAYRHRR